MRSADDKEARYREARALRDSLRPDYMPGKHDPWTGEELPPSKRWTPELFRPKDEGDERDA